jgi:hypothetical protein
MDLAVGHVAALKQILNPDFTGIKVGNIISINQFIEKLVDKHA